MSSVVPTTTPLEHILDSSLIKKKKKTLPKHNSGLTQGIKLIQIPE